MDIFFVMTTDFSQLLTQNKIFFQTFIQFYFQVIRSKKRQRKEKNFIKKVTK